MRMPIRAFQHHGLAAVGSCTLPLFFKQKTAYEISECDWSS
eukprot:SAG31_NODE_42886_length_269_cov_1.200000_1_plen_40_part_10